MEMTQTLAVGSFPIPNPYNCAEWGSKHRNSIEVAVFVASGASTDAWIDARQYAAEYDLPVHESRFAPGTEFARRYK